MAPSVEVATPSGWKALSDIQLGEWITGPDGPQRVLGKVWGRHHLSGGDYFGDAIVDGHPDQTDSPPSPSWIHGGYVWDSSIHHWKPWKTDLLPPKGAIGWNLITDTGEWTARTPTGIDRFRDATEVGHRALPMLYSIVADRLCASGFR
jgi:hypothetical protein